MQISSVWWVWIRAAGMTVIKHWYCYQWTGNCKNIHKVSLIFQVYRLPYRNFCCRSYLFCVFWYSDNVIGGWRTFNNSVHFSGWSIQMLSDNEHRKRNSTTIYYSCIIGSFITTQLSWVVTRKTKDVPQVIRQSLKLSTLAWEFQKTFSAFEVEFFAIGVQGWT